MILMATNWERLLYKCSGLNAKSLFGLDFGRPLRAAALAAQRKKGRYETRL